MPPFNRTVIVSDLGSTRFFEAEAVIDTGSSHSQIPVEAAEYLGLTPEGMRHVQLANGQMIEQPWTNSLIALANVGERVAVPVVIGGRGSAVLLGASALDSFGLGVDTAGERLIPKVWQLLAETHWPTV